MPGTARWAPTRRGEPGLKPPLGGGRPLPNPAVCPSPSSPRVCAVPATAPCPSVTWRDLALLAEEQLLLERVLRAPSCAVPGYGDPRGCDTGGAACEGPAGGGAGGEGRGELQNAPGQLQASSLLTQGDRRRETGDLGGETVLGCGQQLGLWGRTGTCGQVLLGPHPFKGTPCF